MYASYFGLKHEPFSIAPDPRFLFMSERHREALAHLIYGLGGAGGFVLLTGEIGTGKTTLCRLFLEQIPAECNVAYIFNPKLTVTELLQSIGEEFRLPPPQVGTVKAHVDRLNGFLLQAHAAGRNNVLVIDEAQNLEPEVLEQLRLLTNLETRERKLLQIVLIGQPELRDMLARGSLEQLAQRVVARYHLDALTPAETEQYIRHRMDVAGLERPFPFEAGALKRLHEISRGIPRRINLLCDRALLGAYATSRATVDRRVVDRAAQEVFGKASVQPPVRQRTALVLGLGLAAGAGLYAAATRVTQHPEPARAAPASAAAATAAVAHAAPPAAPPPAVPAKLHKEEQEAWRELAALWKAPVGEGDACAELAKSQLQCFSRTLPLSLVRELDRPGIVTLDAQQGRPSYALLTRLTRDRATLRAGGTEQTVTLAALAARWNGEYATLWKAPPGYSKRGEAGALTTEWMRRLLPGAPDAPLKSQLRSFQLAHGLPADGQLGPMTYMQLNRAGGADEPRLAAGP